MRMPSNWIAPNSLLAMALLFGTCQELKAEFLYDVRILPHYFNTDYMTATGVSSAGHVVGQINHGGFTKGYIWYNDSVTLLEGFGSAVTPKDVNASGVVVGQAIGTSGQWHGFSWQAGSITEFLPYIGVQFSSSANSINDTGTIVGYVEGVRPLGGGQWVSPEAWQFPNTSIHRNLGVYFGGMGSIAVSVSENGTIVGTRGEPGGNPWISYPSEDFNQYVQSLVPGVPGDLRGSAEVQGVNDNGLLVGQGWVIDRNRNQFIPIQFADLKAVNNHGLAVGDTQIFYDSGNTDAVIWQDDVWQLLKDVATVPDGYRLNSAFAVNDDGMIVGLATNVVTNQHHAFIATVPEASSLLLSGIGISAVAILRWRRGWSWRWRA